MQYDLIRRDNEYDLKRNVNDAIKNGWKPQGGVTMVITGLHELWIQAMVKE